jgi:RNA polymerase sigma-70 factor, ECF subfamily
LAVKQGEVSAFETLYERWHKKIYNYLWNLLNYNYDDTVSVTSDVFIKFYDYLQTHDADVVKNVKAILYRIAHNAAIDQMRAAHHEYEQTFDDQKMEALPDDDDHK